ncbi:MAG: NAD-dependent epimerase/dehydratase family protein [Thermoplasmata archaeon]
MRFIKGDIENLNLLVQETKNTDLIIHLAANADVQFDTSKSTYTDLKLNIVSTYNELEAMHKNNVKNLIFLSSSAYGLADQIPTPETYDLLIPESL